MSAPVPGWLGALASRLDRFPPLFPDGAPTAPEGTRHSAVLILFGPVDGTADGPEEETDAPAAAEDELARVDILLTERSHDMRSHAASGANRLAQAFFPHLALFSRPILPVRPRCIQGRPIV